MRLWLVRHAVVPSATGLCYGASDLAADVLQTEAVALQLAQALPAITHARCSPLQRCRTLADRLQVLRPDLPIDSDARLAEMNFGRWEGQTWDAIGEPALSAWTADFAGHAPGGGESVAHFMRRIDGALRAFLATCAGDGLWVTHAGVIKAVQLIACGQRHITRADQWPSASVACGQWTVVDLPATGSAPAVRALPPAPH